MQHEKNHNDIIVLRDGEGRSYECGPMTAIFKADENETQSRYSVSEWWLQPNTDGPGAHKHDENDEVFYMLEGTLEFLTGENWINAGKGAFIRIPAGTMHDFKNTTNQKAGVLNFFIPGGFERNMPEIVKYFAGEE